MRQATHPLSHGKTRSGLFVTNMFYVFPQASSLWKGERGLIDRRLVQAHMPPPESDCIILVCGPPPMYNALCGARDDESISGVLADLGYSKNQVYKF